MPHGPDERAPARRRLTRRLACVLLGGAALALAAVAVLVLDLLCCAPPLPPRPAGVGARGPGWEVVAVDGVPLLLHGGLPYPSDLVRPAGRVDLGGRWELRLDPDERGLGEGWASAREGAGWEPFEVPGTFDAAEGPHPDYDGVSWFRRSFVTPPLPPGGRARLALRAVPLRAQVFVNGARVAEHEGGYTPFYADVTDHLRRDAPNLLVVRADDRPTYTSLPPRIRESHRPGWAAYGGLVRPVYLEVLPAAYLAKVAATSRRVGEQVEVAVEAVVHAREPARSSLEARLRAPTGEEVARAAVEVTPHAALGAARLTLTVAEPRAWSPADPALYRLELELTQGEVRDEAALTLGLRELSLEGERLLLEGRPLRLRGIAKHEDHPRHGLTQPEPLLASDLARLRELEVDFVRLAHYPHASAALERYRDAGLLLAEEIPLYQAGMGWLGWAGWDRRPSAFPREWFGLRQLHHPELLANAQLQLIEMVERDRHNPAVILWAVGNECYSLGEGVRPVYAWLREVVRAFDPTRPVTFSELTYGVAALDERRRALAECDVGAVNMYFGWYFGEAADAGPYLDRLRALHPGKPLLVTECGAGAAPGRTEADGPHGGDGVTPAHTYSEAYQAELLEQLYHQAEARPFVAGFSPWVFADFRCPWFPEGLVPGYNLKGVLSRDREPKQSFYALQRLYREAAQREEGR